ncbi:MAG TPA: hypothetical protein VH592_13455 [Gemmataceae bacterium]|jgi:hypothetical protein
MSDKTKPVHKIRNRNLTVTIWSNASANGPFFTLSARRSYKQSEQWKESDSFDEDDLLPLAKLLDQAHTWMVEATHDARKAA